MLPRTNDPIGPTGGNRKQEGLQKSARTRTKVPRNELYQNENATGLATASAPKQRSNLTSALVSKPLSGRVLRPISVNISTPVNLSPPIKPNVRRFRSGSESKIKSLQPVDDPSDVDDPSESSGRPPSDSCKTSVFSQTHSVETSSVLVGTSQLSSQNLQTLSDMLQSSQPPSVKIAMRENAGRDHLKPSGEGISEKLFSLAPTLGSSRRSDCSPSETHTSPQDSPVSEPTILRSTFFNVGIILPARSSEDGSPEKLEVENSARSSESTQVRLTLLRLETMILKQRRVDFEPTETGSKLSQSNENREHFGENDLEAHNIGSQSDETLPSRKIPTVGKVRCALTESERLLGIKWIHNVDTTLTSNPHITPQVRYHASLLFSLYWGSRSPKVPKAEGVSTSEPKTTRDLSADREAKKKLKLIAATAMACLTLTIKWYFDFCKPLFTLQLMSFCKTTDFRTFRITPEDLIIAERAILFSYPVAGGLWLDSPHAFLEELIHVIPSLRLLSQVPSYLLLQRGKVSGANDSKMGQPPKTAVRWDWPKVVNQFERTLAKATMWQEVLAFEPSVLCVVALYIALDGVEAGYHEKNNGYHEINDTARVSSDPGVLTREASPFPGQGSCPEAKFAAKGQEPASVPSADLNDTKGPWIWRWVDINDTMDQVCRTTQVSGDDVESCLDWFCQSESF
ncbi:hypothetical protein PTTG_12688 [Puccinia triticina 1-1 BBBD Race 1]|uniref:Uncharacterized protein n=2 Tax=Puccinia triticina TaxID=208348 RepID=A0A180G9W7_PUCT1|nr:uncharacterized protein PtA15_7A9 [Puccinia triticina]OAV89414.1 hypothetical protein PTTG_12688 [Puccinia triticina 1-1 BBBD Race 1]WAQ86283.1 hypothetical protein PtA15_7A9 [Puccinia triticina]